MSQEPTASAHAKSLWDGGKGDLLQITVFALQHEAEASELNKRKDMCVTLDTRLDIRERILCPGSKPTGLVVHPQHWCNRGPRGFRLSIRAPIQRTDNDAYEVTIQVGDLKIRPGEHSRRCSKRMRILFITTESLSET